MQRKLYVGNLNYDVKEDELKNLFGQFGAVETVTIIRDNYSGHSKGFAFVEMASSGDAEKALSLNGQDLMGRNITVSEARPRKTEGGFREGGSGGKFGRGRAFGGRRNY